MVFCLLSIVVFFFFQAEDGIRDLVRSRGLGDVYKRRGKLSDRRRLLAALAVTRGWSQRELAPVLKASEEAVSYTHLTLPTSDLV